MLHGIFGDFMEHLWAFWKRIRRGSIVVPFCGLHVGFYEVIPKRNYYGAYGCRMVAKVFLFLVGGPKP